VGRDHFHWLAGPWTWPASAADPRDPWGHLAVPADPADHSVLRDPRGDGVDRGRDRLWVAPPERVLDADRVLIASGVSHHPSNLGAEGQRVLYTFLGVGLAVIMMLLVDQLQNRTAAKPAPPQPA
jgi:hypothetical protein